LITLAGGVHFDFEQPSVAVGSSVHELGCCSQRFVLLADRSADRRDKVADALGGLNIAAWVADGDFLTYCGQGHGHHIAQFLLGEVTYAYAH